MKNCLIASLLLVIQSCMAFAQVPSMNDSTIREIQFPLSEKDTETVFYYFNNEWVVLPHLDIVKTDSIQSAEIKNDEYGNRAVFFTVSPAYLAQLKAETHKYFINLDARCEFPGGNGKLKEWLDANIRVPQGYKGSERVVVSFRVQPDGSITEPKIIRPSKNDAANAEALRLVNALPNFRVKYYTPKKSPFNVCLPIRFNEPGRIYIRGGKASFIAQFQIIETKIRQLYENVVFGTATNRDFNMSDICTADFLRRLEQANDYETKGYATWLLRSGMQDGDSTPSKVISIIPGTNNTITVNWSDMGHKGSTTLTMVESDGQWKIDNTTVPTGYNPL